MCRKVSRAHDHQCKFFFLSSSLKYAHVVFETQSTCMHEIHVWEKLLVLVSCTLQKKISIICKSEFKHNEDNQIKINVLKKKKHFHTVRNKGTEADIGVVSF